MKTGNCLEGITVNCQSTQSRIQAQHNSVEIAFTDVRACCHGYTEHF